MCIIFGMIERNVACCHACSAPLQHRGERLAHLRTSPSGGKRRSVRYDSSSYDCSRNDFLSLPLSLLLSSTYYLSSPNSRRSPSARSSSLSPNSLFFPIVPFSPSEVAVWKCHRHRRADSPLFRRRRIFPRNRSAVHQFRRDVVARSLEENYRVQG